MNRVVGATVCLGAVLLNQFLVVSCPLQNVSELLTGNKLMMKVLFLIVGGGVLLFYTASSFLGWELANSGSRSRLGTPFFYSGFRGGK